MTPDHAAQAAPQEHPRRWRCPDCGFANQWEAIECRKCGVISPPDRERWEFKPFVRSDRERLGEKKDNPPMTPEQAAHAAADRFYAEVQDLPAWRDLFVRAFLAGVQWLRETQIQEMIDAKISRDGERPSNALDRRTAPPAREEPND